MIEKINEKMLFAVLILAKDQLTVIMWVTACKLGMGAKRFTDLAKDAADYMKSCDTPRIYWDGFVGHVASLHLNDNESMVYGLLSASFLSDFEGLVVYGRTLAEINDLDYDKVFEQLELEFGLLEHDMGTGLEGKSG
jgi:hypothetical protein